MASQAINVDVGIHVNPLEPEVTNSNSNFYNNYQETDDNWHNIKDKNDNVDLKSEPNNLVEKVCRICFTLIVNDSYSNIFSLESSDYIQNLIKMCLPEVNLLLTRDPVVCEKCYAKLDEFRAFTTECMRSETELLNFCLENKFTSPINIGDFLKHVQNQRLISDDDNVKEEFNSGPVLLPDNETRNSAKSNLDDAIDDSVNAADNTDDPVENDIHDEVDVKSEEAITDNDEKSSLKKGLRKRVRKKKFKTRTHTGDIKLLHSKDLLENSMQCDLCEQTFSSKWALDRHRPVHKGKTANFHCKVCSMKFKYQHSYDKHILAHYNGTPVSKPFICECGKFFNRRSKLIKHQEIHVKKEKPFACKSCGKRFFTEELVNSHIERVHLTEKAFSCEMCGNKYTSKAGLDAHFKNHFPETHPKPEPGIMCDICGKMFYRKYSLEKHRMSHTGNKPHQCEVCDMKFKERYQLTIHMRRHTGEKPFKCEVCDFKFPSKNRLGVHMRTHTGLRPFPCQICEMAFTRNDHLIKHVRAIHTGERPFTCDICSKSFNRKDYLLKHQKVHFKRVQ